MSEANVDTNECEYQQIQYHQNPKKNSIPISFLLNRYNYYR